LSAASAAVPVAPSGGPMALLAGGVPLSLLLDLVLGPRSEDLLVHERPSDEPRSA
jgi:hypothetical protein